MNSFTYDYPVRNYFGEGAMDQALDAEMGAMGKTVMLAYGGGSVKRTGVYGHVVDKLTSAGKRVVDFGDIMPNPTYEKCQEGAALAREEQVDFILSVGGGSVFDCCKVVSAQAMLDEDIETFEHADGKMPSSFIPMGCIATLSGTGAEQNNGAVITNEETHVKGAYLGAMPMWAALDPALTRPGRFDRRVPVELPDLKGREEILKVHAKKVKIAPGVDFNTVARMASGASGAELANIVNEAALRAVRAGRKSVTQADLEESIEVVIAGYQKKNSILTDHEKCIVAYHEIGHALVAAKQSNSAPVQKITIIPRTSGALGYTMQVDEGNHYLMNKAELENKIATLTGGRAAEEVAFNSITTGASNDIEQATKLARAMLTRYGMSDEFDMVALETVNNQYLGGDTSLACSAQIQREIDQKVVELVKTQHEKAIRILTENRAKLDELAQYLYQKETITGEEFMDILNRDDAENKPENP